MNRFTIVVTTVIAVLAGTAIGVLTDWALDRLATEHVIVEIQK